MKVRVANIVGPAGGVHKHIQIMISEADGAPPDRGQPLASVLRQRLENRYDLFYCFRVRGFQFRVSNRPAHHMPGLIPPLRRLRREQNDGEAKIKTLDR